MEIAKALSENVKVLILDEPTSVLAPHETSRLFEVLRKLKQQGVTIIYITHRLEEVFRIADLITILRDGSVTGNYPVSQITQEDIIKHMIGRKINAFYLNVKQAPGRRSSEFREYAPEIKLKTLVFCQGR